MLAKTYGSAVFGIDATTITIEVDVTKGIKFMLVGLPDSAVKESQQRIESALRLNGYKWPRYKIIINMAPADIRKEGAAYDLPLAAAILAASKQISDKKLNNYMLMGELSLDGTLLPVKGILPIAVNARKEGFEGIILPKPNAHEAAVVDRLKVYGAENIREVTGFLNGESQLMQTVVNTREKFNSDINSNSLDFSDVRGQENVKRALEIAASGGHNIILIGPPGSGKTMLARRIPGILPPMTSEESLETTKIHSVAGKIPRDFGLITRRPFRAPHHTLSEAALAGGGLRPMPGEISLAHHGVLFLDELPEFKRSVLEILRQPLEDRFITLSRAHYTVSYPASVTLVASMNPCPCGYYNHPERECICPPGAVRRYLQRISGPLLDRMDMHIEVNPVPFEKLSGESVSETSLQIRERVSRARAVQSQRFESEVGMYCNAQMETRHLHRFCQVSPEAFALLKRAMNKLGLSARAYDRILKVSRTIADLDGAESITPAHISEAIRYRSLDRDRWGMP